MSEPIDVQPTTRAAPGERRGSTLAALLDCSAHVGALVESFQFLKDKRKLVLAMAARELNTRYAGQMFGILWALGHPLFQMVVFVYVFGVVFQQKIGGTYEFPRDYTVYILSGLASWLSIAPVIAAATTILRSSANLIKQFTFDSRILPVREVVVGSVVWLVSVGVVVIYSLIKDGTMPWTYLLLPVLAAQQMMLTLGLAWAIAGVSAFIRDLKDIVTLINSVMIYVLPIVYLPDWLPAQFKPIIYLNPLSYTIWTYQDVLYYGRIEHPWAWVISPLTALVVFTSGYRLFRRLSPSFGAVL